MSTNERIRHRELTITISGARGEGKSVLADLLRDELGARGVTVKVKDGTRLMQRGPARLDGLHVVINVEQA